jgi:acetoacetyl-CoA synthetase
MANASPLFRPSHPEHSATFRFLARINQSLGLSLVSYSDLYKWSIDNIDLFWSSVWDYTDILGEKGANVVQNDALPPSNPAWYVARRFAFHFIVC